jgi:hypothetical protein
MPPVFVTATRRMRGVRDLNYSCSTVFWTAFVDADGVRNCAFSCYFDLEIVNSELLVHTDQGMNVGIHLLAVW